MVQILQKIALIFNRIRRRRGKVDKRAYGRLRLQHWSAHMKKDIGIIDDPDPPERVRFSVMTRF